MYSSFKIFRNLKKNKQTLIIFKKIKWQPTHEKLN